VTRELAAVWLSGALILGGNAWIWADGHRERTEIRPVSWATWTGLTAAAAVAASRQHHVAAAVFAAADCIGCAAITLTWWRRPRAERDYDVMDVVCAAGAGAGLGLVVSAPAAAVAAVIVTDSLALVLTIRHGWNQPQEETWQGYVLCGAGGLAALYGAVWHWDAFTGWAFPLYMAVAATGAGLVFWARRRHLAVAGAHG
jgi:hypothetical protein